MQVPGPPRWGAYGAPADQRYQQYGGMQAAAGVMPHGQMRWRASGQMQAGPGGMRSGGMQHFNPAPGPPPGKVRAAAGGCWRGAAWQCQGCGGTARHSQLPVALPALPNRPAACCQHLWAQPVGPPSLPLQGGRNSMANGTRGGGGMVGMPHDAYGGSGHGAAMVFHPFMVPSLMMQHQQQHASPWGAPGMMQQQVGEVAAASAGAGM